METLIVASIETLKRNIKKFGKEEVLHIQRVTNNLNESLRINISEKMSKFKDVIEELYVLKSPSLSEVDSLKSDT